MARLRRVAGRGEPHGGGAAGAAQRAERRLCKRGAVGDLYGGQPGGALVGNSQRARRPLRAGAGAQLPLRDGRAARRLLALPSLRLGAPLLVRRALQRQRLGEDCVALLLLAPARRRHRRLHGLCHRALGAHVLGARRHPLRHCRHRRLLAHQHPGRPLQPAGRPLQCRRSPWPGQGGRRHDAHFSHAAPL